MVKGLRTRRQDRWLLSLPLFHVSGQGIVWRWLAAGATLVLRDKYPLVEALVGYPHASLVPTQLWRLLAQPLEGMTLKGGVLGGAMIPEDIERVLATHPQILQVFVVPMDDIEFGQRPVAVIDSERPLTLEALLNCAQEWLASFKRPAALFNLPNELKKGGIKISRQQLQQWVAVQIFAA